IPPQPFVGRPRELEWLGQEMYAPERRYPQTMGTSFAANPLTQVFQELELTDESAKVPFNSSTQTQSLDVQHPRDQPAPVAGSWHRPKQDNYFWAPVTHSRIHGSRPVTPQCISLQFARSVRRL